MADEKGIIGKLENAVQARLAKNDAAYIAQAGQWGGESTAAIAEASVKDRQEGHYIKALVEGAEASEAIHEGQEKFRNVAKENAEIDNARKQGGEPAAALMEEALQDYKAGNYKNGLKEEFEASVIVSMGQLKSGLAKVEELFNFAPTTPQVPDPSRPAQTPIVNTTDLGNKGPAR